MVIASLCVAAYSNLYYERMSMQSKAATPHIGSQVLMLSGGL